MAQSVNETYDEGNPSGDGEECKEPEAMRLQQVVACLKQELKIKDISGSPRTESPLEHIPVFLGRGSDDEKVPCELGRKAALFLQDMEIAVDWNEYEALGHSFSAGMLRDIVKSILKLDGWTIGF